MRATALSLLAAAALAACGQPPVETPPEVAAAEATPPTVAPGASAGIDGWEIDMTAYDRIGTTLPAFTGRKSDGTEVTAESLRGRWTILGLWGPTPAGDETNFAAALNSAADQDPDLDLLIQHPALDGAAPPEGPWPKLQNSSLALTPPMLPSYLLIGPDLTIEGYRGALTTTPDDGIKSVIRGVAEIRKQVTAPQ